MTCCPSCGSQNVFTQKLLTEVPESHEKTVLKCEDCQRHEVIECDNSPRLLLD